MWNFFVETQFIASCGSEGEINKSQKSGHAQNAIMG
jgi:hypothetical protein